MKKIVIGIICPRNISLERPFHNYIKFASNFPKMVIDAGGIPVGLLFPEGKFIKEQMDLCDGFLFQGGSIIEPWQVMAVKYGLDSNKPILGICLGMQTIAAFEWLHSNEPSLSYDLIKEKFTSDSENFFLKEINGHNKVDPYYKSEIEKSKHDIHIDKNSILYKIYQKNIIRVPSVHNYAIKENIFNNSTFKIVSRSEDGIIEAIESVDEKLWAVGVQFHPELEDDNIQLFKTFIKECENRK